MDWYRVISEFDFDGSWRALYLFDTNIDGWQKLVDLLRSSEYHLRYQVDGEVAPLPKNVKDISKIREEANPLLCVEVNGITFNCHFFCERQIEFDFDPREINSQEKLNCLIGLMHCIWQWLNKKVVMTPENCERIVIFEYLPGRDEIKYIPYGI